VATRILAHLGALAPDGRVASLVGSEVVYVGGRTASPATMTPYDVAAVRLGDGLDLAGAPPADVARYLEVLRTERAVRAVAAVASGELVAAGDLATLVEHIARLPWAEAEAHARTAGALVGAYAAES
jgi:hypothetical protein